MHHIQSLRVTTTVMVISCFGSNVLNTIPWPLSMSWQSIPSSFIELFGIDLSVYSYKTLTTISITLGCSMRSLQIIVINAAFLDRKDTLTSRCPNKTIHSRSIVSSNALSYNLASVQLFRLHRLSQFFGLV